MSVSALRGAHWGRRCWVLCNGPSLNKIDLRALSDEITIGMNGIFLKQGFRPTYHVVEDREFAADRADEINDYRGPVKVYAADLAGLRADYPVRFARSGFADRPKFSVDLSAVVYWGGTVTYMALQLAYYLGCSEVYIVGADHHMEVPAGTEVNGGTYSSAGTDPNHFDPDYFGSGKRWHAPNWPLQERAYAMARAAFARAGRRVLNASVGGRLEVFDRVDWRKVVAS